MQVSAIDKHNHETTAIASRNGLYQIVRMPFELKNAFATFQREMDVILSTVK